MILRLCAVSYTHLDVYKRQNKNNLGILKNIPTSILSKLNISHSFLATNNDSEIEVSIISGASTSEAVSYTHLDVYKRQI